ncbi:MAG: hypothetical protein TREMPRED_002924 [Tremellales sp. Tagirdzhanova-0007]|nr:MAG: hypothetical protein TREMPRED_002924 [Tremellales sp. Tagirdzhanova-0007]
MIFLISLTSWLCGYLTASFPSLQSEQQGESFRSTDWQVNSSVPIERQAESYLPTEKHVDIAIRVRELRVSLEKRFPKDLFSNWANHRSATLDALDRLAVCTEHNDCGSGEMTVIVLGSFHFGHSQRGHVSGEDIWAGSIVELLKTHNFTLLYTYQPLEALLVYQAIPELIPLVFLESADLDQCLKLSRIDQQATEASTSPIEGIDQNEPGEKVGCVKQVGFESGIPVQKIRTFHFWNGQRHPLEGWTVSPENYNEWTGGTKNYYLGYWLPHCEHVSPSSSRLPRAFVLGKRPEYFEGSNYVWPRNMLLRVAQLMSEPESEFEFVGGIGQTRLEDLEPGITNLGVMGKEVWNREVQKSAAMLGVGKPFWSPSPYDAWCMGVPFINPITKRDPSEPENRAKWKTQHDGLLDFDPPYVYHVPTDDENALLDALQSAVVRPIDPYIPERMTRESVDKRLLHLVNHNWTAEAEQLILRDKASGFWIPQLPSHHARDGLLL